MANLKKAGAAAALFAVIVGGTAAAVASNNSDKTTTVAPVEAVSVTTPAVLSETAPVVDTSDGAMTVTVTRTFDEADVVPADSDTPAETFTVAAAAGGHSVALTYGPGVDAFAVQAAGRTISDAGCPTTMQSGGRPNNVQGTVNGTSKSDSDPDVVARWAIEHCTKPLKEASPTDKSAARGLPVTFTYGPGISRSAVQGAVDVIASNGCLASMESGGRPNRVTGAVNGDSWSNSDPAAVAAWAIDECTKPLNNNSPTAKRVAGGHPVTFTYGPGIDAQDAKTSAAYLTEQGCPATASAGGRPNNIKVSNGVESVSFKEVGAAQNHALTHFCNS
ncbi:MAG: hypothetical protein AAF720_02520 [Pseudomonadota bacterium]